MRDCDVAGGVACSECWSDTKIFTGEEMLCSKCGAFYNPSGANVEVRCHKCDEHFYDRAFAAGIYQSALSVNLLELKRLPTISSRVVTAIQSAIHRTELNPDLLVPVPLARERRLERGFNQAELIANEVARVTNLRVDSHSLARRVHTPIHRIGMDDKARSLTVEKAFEVVRPKLMKGRSILLVDDVFTSGATASACAKVLKKSGASEVMVFTVARAVMR